MPMIRSCTSSRCSVIAYPSWLYQYCNTCRLPHTKGYRQLRNIQAPLYSVEVLELQIRHRHLTRQAMVNLGVFPSDLLQMVRVQLPLEVRRTPSQGHHCFPRLEPPPFQLPLFSETRARVLERAQALLIHKPSPPTMDYSPHLMSIILTFWMLISTAGFERRLETIEELSFREL